MPRRRLLDPRGALPHGVAVDDLAGELPDLDRDIELLVHPRPRLLALEVADPAVNAAYPSRSKSLWSEYLIRYSSSTISTFFLASRYDPVTTAGERGKKLESDMECSL